MRIDAISVDDYLSKVPDRRRRALRELRALIQMTLPDAEESMAFGIPTFSTHAPLVAFSVQKNYMSLYVNAKIVRRHSRDLGAVDIGTTCVRFRRWSQLPLPVIEDMIREAADCAL